MKYEFHVGDYVETKEGGIGYISSVLATGDAWWVCVIGCNGYQVGEEYGIMHNGDFPHRYNRVGQYDFTKPEVKKIDHFEYNHPCSEISLTAKINELVDAVNELREKL